MQPNKKLKKNKYRVQQQTVENVKFKNSYVSLLREWKKIPEIYEEKNRQ